MNAFGTADVKPLIIKDFEDKQMQKITSDQLRTESARVPTQCVHPTVCDTQLSFSVAELHSVYFC